MTGHEFYGNALVCTAIACGFVLITLLAVTKPRTPPGGCPDGCEVIEYPPDAVYEQPTPMFMPEEPEDPEDPEDSVAQPHRPVDTA